MVELAGWQRHRRVTISARASGAAAARIHSMFALSSAASNFAGMSRRHAPIARGSPPTPLSAPVASPRERFQRTPPSLRVTVTHRQVDACRPREAARRDPETRAIADPSHDARANLFPPLSIPVGAHKGLATPRRVAARAAVAPSPFAKLQAGDKVKVTESVVVYHVPKSKGAATDLNGMEGEVASRADDLNGTYISANLEVRVAFAVPDDPKGKTFIAHMKEDEVEAL